MKWLPQHLAVWALMGAALAGRHLHSAPEPDAALPPPAPGAGPESIDTPLVGPPPAPHMWWGTGRAQVARHVIGLLARGHFATAVATWSATSPAPSAYGLEETWARWQERLGAFQGIVDTQPGRLYAQDAVWVGADFARGAATIIVVFDEGGKIRDLQLGPPPGATLPEAEYEAPGYVRRAAFEEVDLTIGTPPWTLAATLSLPTGEVRVPGVVLVPGGGRQNRDEARGAVRPFRDLAWGLASGAIAALRYDTRRAVYGPEIAHSPAYTPDDEVIDDAVAAIAALSAEPRVDPDHIFVLGHGLAGGLLPRIAARVPALAGGIILAGWSRALPQVLLDQARFLGRQTDPDVPAREVDVPALEAEAARAQDPAALADLPPDALLLGRPVAYWRALAGYQPAAVAAASMLPLLILQGERDYQVSLADFAGWQQGLAGRAGVQFQSYPALGHPFVPGEDGPSPDDYRLAKHVPDAVVEEIGNWVRAH